MSAWILMFVAGTVLGPVEVENGGVRVRVDVRANTYTLRVTNVSAPPIVHFEIGQNKAYALQNRTAMLNALRRSLELVNCINCNATSIQYADQCIPHGDCEYCGKPIDVEVV